MDQLVNRPVRVLLACSGLDHARRGFESFARECFEELRGAPEIDLYLAKGSGSQAPHERSLPSLTRDSRFVHALSRLSGKQPFRFEHLAFGFSLQPILLRRKPDVVYFSEWHTGLALAALRKATRQTYKLVLSNGTLANEGFDHLDRVQEHTQPALEAVLARGATPARHTLLPVGFVMEPQLIPPSDEERRALRRRLDLPVERPIVLSVAAVNRHHKRMDYLVEEVGRLPEPRPFVLLLGDSEAETPGIEQLAAETLGSDGYAIRSVPRSEVDLYCRASDVFVLASLGEGLPRALVEAMGHGLPCLTHDYGVTHFATGPHGRFGDFTRPGGLSELLEEQGDPRQHDEKEAKARHRYVYENFSWDSLRPRYLDMLVEAAGHRDELPA